MSIFHYSLLSKDTCVRVPRPPCFLLGDSQGSETLKAVAGHSDWAQSRTRQGGSTWAKRRANRHRPPASSPVEAPGRTLDDTWRAAYQGHQFQLPDPGRKGPSTQQVRQRELLFPARVPGPAQHPGSRAPAQGHAAHRPCKGVRPAGALLSAQQIIVVRHRGSRLCIQENGVRISAERCLPERTVIS